jgi:hypothetical protein
MNNVLTAEESNMALVQRRIEFLKSCQDKPFSPRKSSMKAFDHGYAPPSPREIREAMKDYTSIDIASMVGVDERTVRRWKLDESKTSYRTIPYSAWRLFLILDGVVPAAVSDEAITENVRLLEAYQEHPRLPRKPSLRPFNNGFVTPTPEEIQEVFGDYSSDEIAAIVGVEEAAVRRWQLDTSKPSYRAINYSAWRLFLVLTGVVAAI